MSASTRLTPAGLKADKFRNHRRLGLQLLVLNRRSILLETRVCPLTRLTTASLKPDNIRNRRLDLILLVSQKPPSTRLTTASLNSGFSITGNLRTISETKDLLSTRLTTPAASLNSGSYTTGN